MMDKIQADAWAHAVGRYIRTGYLDPQGFVASVLQYLPDVYHPIDRRHVIARNAQVFLAKFMEPAGFASAVLGDNSINCNMWIIFSVEVALHEVEGCVYADPRGE